MKEKMMSEYHRTVQAQDLLSSLPDDILITILSLTKSYKQAVKCSVLSKRWRDLYKNLPCLYFYLKEFFNLEDDTIESLEKTRLAVNRHEAHVYTLYLKTNRKIEYWDWCVKHFTDRNVQHLILHTNHHDFNNRDHVLPCILSCTSLVTLTLKSAIFSISLSDPFLGYPNLRECDLSLHVDSDALKWLSQILSKSSLLQKLSLKLLFSERSVEVYNAPLTFSSHSLLDLDVYLLGVSKPLQIGVVASELLKMRLMVDAELQEEEVVRVTMRESPKLSKVSIPYDNKSIILDFQQSGLPKLYERLSYAKFQGFPNLYECKIHLFNLTLCADVAKGLHDLLSRSPNLRNLTVFLSFKDNGDEEESYDMPLTFLSQNLFDLDITVESPKKQLQMKIVAPQLQTLTMYSDTSHKMQLEVEAPNLSKCEMNLSSLTLCANVAKLLNHLMSQSPNLQYLSLSLCFDDDDDYDSDDDDEEEEKEKEEEEEENYDMPLTFFSQSLLDLNIRITWLKKQLQIKVVAPQLQNLILFCDDREQTHKIQVEVKAPKLLGRYRSLEAVDRIVNADSESFLDIHLMFLNFSGSLNSKCSIFDKSMVLGAVSFLELSHFDAYPTDIWNKLLTCFCWLKTLIFTNCTFKSEGGPKDVYIKEHRLLYLKEIRFVDQAYNGLDGEKEILSFLLQNAPALQTLSFSLQKKKCEYKDDYYALLGRLLAPGDMVICNESSHEMQLKMLKGSV